MPQLLIICLKHIVVALGMGKHGDIALGLDAKKNVVKTAWRVEVGGFHQEVLALLAYWQQVALLQTLLKETVEHILGGKAKDYWPFIGGLQLRETHAQKGSGVRHVLHDVWSEPHLLDPMLFVGRQYLKRLLDGLDTIVHTGKKMTVPIGISFENTTIGDAISFAEWPHGGIKN